MALTGFRFGQAAIERAAAFDHFTLPDANEKRFFVASPAG